MLVSRKKYRSLEEQNKSLKAQLELLKRELDKLVLESVANGEHLRGEIFIPEYLGFTETVVRNKKDDTVDVRVYTKDEYNISRGSGNEWAVLGPNQKAIIRINNMLEAIIVLGALGCPVSINTIMNDTTDLEKFADNLKIEE